MKIIVAGLPKTGTKTMHAACNILGYKVFDIMDHFEHHCEHWHRFWDGKGQVEDFKEMYKDVEVGVDGPMFFYWEEILKAFPDMKIILTIRDEDAWWKSIRNQINIILSNTAYRVMTTISPTGRRYNNFVNRLVKTEFGIPMNEIQWKREFRHSNSYVM
uniref:Sulfotransferase n=1 Tax=Ciona savignyi TaxID=51511 RepID=H2Y851_CIOSA